jgi:hypothetical protein
MPRRQQFDHAEVNQSREKCLPGKMSVAISKWKIFSGNAKYKCQIQKNTAFIAMMWKTEAQAK